MCGISGIFNFSETAPISQEHLKSMNTAQSHRGPDAEGYFFGDGVALGHRRLSIIDVSGGGQPIVSEDKNAVIVFNGEIFNHSQIADELKAKGYHYQTHSDTETILHAWREWGVECLHKLRGMFAFLIWDEKLKQLFVARDRLGVKPLHYALLNNGTVLFGSEIKVLKAHPDFDRSLDYTAVEDYLTFGYVPDPKSIYRNVKKLQAGHYLLFQQCKGEAAAATLPTPIQYWDLPWDAPNHEDVEEAKLISQFRESVDIRLESEVPPGAFLSGGVDSSAVVAMMAGLQSTPVTTCSIGFDVPQYNESEFARIVSDKYKTLHHCEVVNHEDFELVDKMTQLYDEPYADSSSLPTYKVCELARKHVTVALSGDGGDELFAGYRRYRLHLNEQKVRDAIPLWIRKHIFGFLGKYYPKLDWAPQFLRAKTTFQSLSMSSSQAYLNSMSKLRKDERNALYKEQFKTTLNGYDAGEVFEDVLDGKVFEDKLKEAQYLDFKTWVTGDIHTKVDRASMAHGLEVRVPLFDHKFVEWAFRLPSSVNLKNGEGKYSFKKALEPFLPDDTLYRKKMGFSVPLAEWLRGPLQDKMLSLLSSEAVKKHNIFEHNVLMKKAQEHISGRYDHSASLWTIMMLCQFLVKEEASK